MITLNLLPPEKKQGLRFSEFYLVIKNFIITLLLLMIISAIILLFTKLALQNHFNRIVDETTLTTKVGQLFNQDIKNFNKIISNVETIQKEYTAWTQFIAKFSELTPSGVNFSNVVFSHSGDQNKIVLAGFADLRSQLLDFQANLENSPLFDDVVMPLENLLKKEHLEFNIKANINLEYLNKTDEN